MPVLGGSWLPALLALLASRCGAHLPSAALAPRAQRARGAAAEPAAARLMRASPLPAGVERVALAVRGRGGFSRLQRAGAGGAQQLQVARGGEDIDLDAEAVPAPAPEHPGKGQPQKNATGSAKSKKKDSKDMKDDQGGFLMSVTQDQLLWCYSGIVPIVVIACIIFECVHRRWAGIDLSAPIDGLNRESEAGQGMRPSTWLSGFWPLTSEFFIRGEMAGLAKMLMMVLLFLSFWSLFMDWARNIWQRDFWDAIENKDAKRFWKAMLLFIQMAVVNVLSSTYQSYTNSILTIRWRAALTKKLQERWLLGRAFYVQHFPSAPGSPPPLDNPDQRLQEDVAGFINGGIAIFFGIFMVVGRLALFCPILCMESPNYAFGYIYCPGWLLYVSIAYSAVGSFFTHIAGRWLIPLSFIKQRVEADYRHAAVQVRDNGDSIALYGSEETEHNRLMSRFDTIQRVVWEQMKYGKQLGFFRNFYFLTNDIAPFCILAGNYFKGQITLGQLMQILGALGHVSDSLNSFVQAYTDIADLRATTDRLYGFSKGVEKGAKLVEDTCMNREVSPPGDTAALYAQDVCVRFGAPEGSDERVAETERVLWNKAGLVVQPGERVLLLGPDGCGKSCYLRALAGVWPASGSVRIGHGDVLFVPQKPFVPAGELREALAYPEGPSIYTDEEMLVALKAVRLTALDDIPLDQYDDWQKRLSGGELQRFALAHALLRKPGLLVLDETTSAIGEVQTAELYAVLAKLLPPSTAIISVDHDAIREVGSWHNVHYTIDQTAHKWIPA